MPTLTIIVGMAGSGKSSECDRIARNRNIPGFQDATLTGDDDERRAGHRCLGEIVARLIGRSESCVIDESHLTMPSFRQSFATFCDQFLKDIDLEWIFFKADVVACINNVCDDAEVGKRDDHFKRYEALRKQYKVYSVPSEEECPGRQVREVYKCKSPKFQASEKLEAVKWLESEIERLRK